MKSGFTEAGVFWMYAAICVLGSSYVAFFLPETKVPPYVLISWLYVQSLRDLYGFETAPIPSQALPGTAGPVVPSRRPCALSCLSLSCHF